MAKIPGARESGAPPKAKLRKQMHLRNVAAYREPLWALVTVDLERGELVVEEKRTEWVGPDPWARGAPESAYPREKNRPTVSPRRIALAKP